MKCKQCQSEKFDEKLEPTGAMHYSRLICSSCGAFGGWGKHPNNEEAKRKNNNKWKYRHREGLGQFICSWCGVDESIYKDFHTYRFQLDHVVQLSEGGRDEFENTQILCFECHGFKTNSRNRVTAIKKVLGD